jgi:histidyl-tRNA synthetase
VQFDPTLVRGMGYYTGTIFEAVMPGFSGSVAGGGRYDRMIGKLLGREVPACGFSIGFERLVAILGERGADAPAVSTGQPRRVALIVDDGAGVGHALLAARALRAAGDLVSIELRRKNVGKQLDDLTRHGFDAHATLDADGRPIVKPLTRRERA